MFVHATLEMLSTKIVPFALSVLGFGLLIVVHELGHFLFCKLFGINTPTFSIGFGKKIFEKRIGSTNFRLAQIPFGGYVEIAGLSEPGQGEQLAAHDRGATSFALRPYWQKLLVMMGGILFNLAFAYLAFIGLHLVGDKNAPKHVTISAVVQDSAAERAGLQGGDQILAIDSLSLEGQGATLHDRHQEILKIIRANPGELLSFTIQRGEERLEVAVTIDSRAGEGNAKIGSLGAYFPPVIERLPLLQAIQAGITKTNQWIVIIATSLKNLFLARSLEGAGGPVMILAQGFKTAQQGLFTLFIFLALMSINLALFNLLPLGITDGGVLLLSTIEFIIRRPLPDFFRIGLNIVSWALFIIFALYLTYKDIVVLFGGAISSMLSLAKSLIK